MKNVYLIMIRTSHSGINRTLEHLKLGMFSTGQKVLGKSLTQTNVHANKTAPLLVTKQINRGLSLQKEGETDYQLPFKL